MNTGKLDIVIAEMERVKLSLLGLSDLTWKGRGHFTTGSQKIYYSGNDNIRRNGVAFMVDRPTSKVVLGYNPINDRVISIRLQGQPMNWTIIQVYAPPANSEEEDIEEFYSALQSCIDNTPKKDFFW